MEGPKGSEEQISTPISKEEVEELEQKFSWLREGQTVESVQVDDMFGTVHIKFKDGKQLIIDGKDSVVQG